MDVILLNEIQDMVGTTGATGGSTTAGTVMAKLNAIIGNTAVNNTESATGNLSQKSTAIFNYVKSILGATGDGGGTSSKGSISAKLNALLATWTSTRAGYVDRLANSTYGLDKIKSDTGSILSKVNNGVGIGRYKGTLESAGLVGYYDNLSSYAFFYNFYSSATTIPSGTVLCNVNAGIMHSNYENGYQNLQIQLGMGTGTFKITVDDYTTTATIKTTGSNTQINISIPAGFKISHIKLETTTEVRISSNKAIYVYFGNIGAFNTYRIG